jgi:hypothetical protein
VQTQMKIASAHDGVHVSLGAHPDGAHKTGVRHPLHAATKRAFGHQFQVIRASDFVCFDAERHLNFEESKRVLQELALACRKRGLDRAMVDLRDLPVPEKPRFTWAELAEMAGAFRAAGFTGRQRLAVLHSHDTHGTIRDFVTISRMKGLQVEAFNQFDKAIHWLGKSTEHPAECKHGAEVPIVRKKQAPSVQAKAKAKTTKTTTKRKRARVGRWHLARRSKIRTHGGRATRPARKPKRSR